MSESLINENVKFFNKGVLIYVQTYDEALLAKDAGILSVIVLFDKEYNMARLDLVHEIKTNLGLHCIVQARKGNTLETFLLNGSGADAIHNCIHDEDCKQELIDHKLYTSQFLTNVDSLEKAIKSINEMHSILRIGNDKSSITDLSDLYVNINTKIVEFYTFKNENSINKFSKEIKVNRKVVENISNLRRLPVPLLAEGLIKNPIDAVNVMRMGYDAIILSHDIFSTRNPSLMIELVVNSVKNFSNDLKILESCTETFKIHTHNKNE